MHTITVRSNHCAALFWCLLEAQIIAYQIQSARIESAVCIEVN